MSVTVVSSTGGSPDAASVRPAHRHGLGGPAPPHACAASAACHSTARATAMASTSGGTVAQRGTLPCFRDRASGRFDRSMARPLISAWRVTAGSMTSST